MILSLSCIHLPCQRGWSSLKGEIKVKSMIELHNRKDSILIKLISLEQEDAIKMVQHVGQNNINSTNYRKNLWEGTVAST